MIVVYLLLKTSTNKIRIELNMYKSNITTSNCLFLRTFCSVLNYQGCKQIKMRTINNKLSQFINKGPGWKQSIPNHYRTYFTSGSVQTIPHGDIVVLALEIIKFNVETKQRLQKIYKKYHSEEFVKELLIRLLITSIAVIEPEYDLY